METIPIDQLYYKFSQQNIDRYIGDSKKRSNFIYNSNKTILNSNLTKKVDELIKDNCLNVKVDTIKPEEILYKVKDGTTPERDVIKYLDYIKILYSIINLQLKINLNKIKSTSTEIFDTPNTKNNLSFQNDKKKLDDLLNKFNVYDQTKFEINDEEIKLPKFLYHDEVKIYGVSGDKTFIISDIELVKDFTNNKTIWKYKLEKKKRYYKEYELENDSSILDTSKNIANGSGTIVQIKDNTDIQDKIIEIADIIKRNCSLKRKIYSFYNKYKDTNNSKNSKNSNNSNNKNFINYFNKNYFINFYIAYNDLQNIMNIYNHVYNIIDKSITSSFYELIEIKYFEKNFFNFNNSYNLNDLNVLNELENKLVTYISKLKEILEKNLNKYENNFYKFFLLNIKNNIKYIDDYLQNLENIRFNKNELLKYSNKENFDIYKLCNLINLRDNLDLSTFIIDDDNFYIVLNKIYKLYNLIKIKKKIIS